MATAAEKLDAHLRHTKAKLAGLERELLTFAASRKPEDQAKANMIKKHRLYLKDRINRLEGQLQSMIGSATFHRPALA